MDVSQFKVKGYLDQLTVDDLRKLLGERGKKTSGLKSALTARLWPLIKTEQLIAGPLSEVS
jgi:hypothetical protein